MLARRIDGGFTTPLTRLAEQMDRLFDDVFFNLDRPTWLTAPTTMTVYPPINVWEDETNLYVEADVPGLKMDDLEVLVEGNQLTLRGERKFEQREKANFYRCEQTGYRFHRVITLPVEIDADKVEARLHDGVLHITLPKVESARARKIQVKALPTG